MMLEEFEYDREHCYSLIRNCAIQMWRGEVNSQHISQMEDRWKRVIRRSGKLGIFVIVLPSAPPPATARRDEIKRLYIELQKNISAVGTVLEDQGMRGTAGSMAMTTIMLMSRIPYPYKNGISIPEMAAWMAGQMQTVDERNLVSAVQEMRRRYFDVVER